MGEDQLQDEHGAPSAEGESNGAAVDPLIGSVLGGRYRVEGHLGEGGMGRVYRGEHQGIGRAVAIKVLNAEFAQHAQVVERFKREARAATTAGNEHIIDVFDLGELPDKAPYIVMELLSGSELGDLIEDGGPMTVGRAARIGIQVCDALDAAHAKGIVHRDLKPENIFVLDDRSQEDFVKVLDFGISKFTDPSEKSHKLTQTGMTLGTPLYMSPEQAQGLPETDHRTDIYSLGVILFIALTGHAPFEADTFPLLVVKIVTGDIPSLRSRRKDVPPSFDAIVQRCLSKNPDARFNTAARLRAALESFVDIEDDPVMTDPGSAATIRPPALAAAASGSHPQDFVSTAALGGDTKGEPSQSARRPSSQEATRPGTALEESDPSRRSAAQVAEASSEGLESARANTPWTTGAESQPELPTKRPSTPVLIGAVAGVLGVLALVAAASMGGESPPSRDPRVGAGSAMTPATMMSEVPSMDTHVAGRMDTEGMEAETSEVEVFLAAVPREAHVFLDDIEFPNPFRGPRPRSLDPVTLRIELAGYETIERPVVFSGDTDIVETLSPTRRTSMNSMSASMNATAMSGTGGSTMSSTMSDASEMNAMTTMSSSMMDGFRDDF